MTDTTASQSERAQPAPADVVEAVKRMVRDCIKYDVPSDALDLRADEVAHAALSVIPVSGEVERLRPVESAPKDGSFFLFVGSNFDGGMAVVQWDTGMDWWTLDDGKNPEIPLRHEAKLEGWLPLPRFARQALNSAPDVGA